MVPSHNGLKGALISCRAGQTKTSIHTLDQQPVQVRCTSCDRPPTPLKVQARHVCPGPKRDHRQNLPRPTIGVHSTRKLMACHLGEQCRRLHHRLSGTWRNRAQDSTNSAKRCAIVEAHPPKLHRRESSEKKGGGCLAVSRASRLASAQPPHECPTEPLTERWRQSVGKGADAARSQSRLFGKLLIPGSVLACLGASLKHRSSVVMHSLLGQSKK